MNFFDIIMGMFVEPAQKIAKSLAEHASNFFHAQLILNMIISILFMIWAYRRIKEGDMFQFKTAMGVVVFVVFVGFINWGIKNPNDFNTYFINTIFYPAEKLAILIAQSLNDDLEIPTNANLSPSEMFSIGNLASSAYAMIVNLWDNAFNGVTMFNWLTMIPKLIMFFLVMLGELLFLGLLLIIVLLVTAEIFMWSALGLIVLPLGLIPQTKGMLFSYLKKLISLTFYKPCMMLVAFLNYGVIYKVNALIPTKTEITQGFYGNADKMAKEGHIIDAFGNVLKGDWNSYLAHSSIVGVLTIIVLGSVICFFLIKRVPDFINNIFGTSGGVGAVTEMMQKIGMTIGGAVVGGSMVMVANQAKQAYQSAGGGLAGLQAGARAMFGAGLSGGITTMANAKGAKAGVRHFVASVKSGFGLDNDRNNK
ncbi:P-type conjugative transfer protein TrbL [Helicobacter pylori]|uniref:P-type conjugative transfer protein TrbL n=1 Tax=Helicobacter pylori TaxID=210 RepID=UPI0013F43EC0|nr:P-type conjugative transfer protein TrbL [Helicobacter pylori]NHB23867.1 P-type conjugative transfer protein TrbL [Helicobacter pylori]NHB24898.1 P-type conjugative transfer protein TrbL [Helicobacter pylori]NHB25997.1 P-type conjugative transfer protein TrbL [Helicobacter pylori]NHB28255.1 P-type conjugative transfer protein TrbL [Helicobacter pylori]NHB56076.1 P-type conjugative transfer protein TrbL [Helicobacter pylori]